MIAFMFYSRPLMLGGRFHKLILIYKACGSVNTAACGPADASIRIVL